MESKGTTDIGSGKVVEDTTPVKLVGSGSVKVTVDGSQSSGPVITIDGIEYGIAGSAKEAGTGENAKLTVGKQSVNIVGEGATKVAYKNNEVGFKSDLSAYNLENQMENSNDEAAANSIINNKKLVVVAKFINV